MNLKQRQNDTHRRKLEHSEKNLSQNHPVHHKSQTDWPVNATNCPSCDTSWGLVVIVTTSGAWRMFISHQVVGGKERKKTL